MNRRWKIGLIAAVPVILVAALFAAIGMNYFPQSTYGVKSFKKVTKLWTAGDYVCGSDGSTLRCSLLGLGSSPVENTISVSFLNDPLAIVEALPEVCALEQGQVLCWNMAARILGGLGAVYSEAQQEAGFVDHGDIVRSSAERLPTNGVVRALVAVSRFVCTVADDGVTCFHFPNEKVPLAKAVWRQRGRAMFVAENWLCVDDAEAMQCFEVPADKASTEFKARMRLTPSGDITAFAKASGSVCVLRKNGGACAERPSGDPPIADLVLKEVPELRSASKLWSAGSALFAVDDSSVLSWPDRSAPAPKPFTTLAAGESVYPRAESTTWFLFRKGQLVRSPQERWPRRYSFERAPSQVLGTGTEDCALVDEKVSCFRY